MDDFECSLTGHRGKFESRRAGRTECGLARGLHAEGYFVTASGNAEWGAAWRGPFGEDP